MLATPLKFWKKRRMLFVEDDAAPGAWRRRRLRGVEDDEEGRERSDRAPPRRGKHDEEGQKRKDCAENREEGSVTTDEEGPPRGCHLGRTTALWRVGGGVFGTVGWLRTQGETESGESWGVGTKVAECGRLGVAATWGVGVGGFDF
ncbi:hypothetical protein AAHE18_U038500 [Arachis hypogaea]